MLIAQISDTHVQASGRPAYGIVDTAGMLAACVADVLRQDPRPDLVLLTGDLADHGDPGEYALLRELLAPLTMPMYLLPGNHDERAALRQAFTGPRFGYFGQTGEFLQYAVDLGPLRLLALDTVVPMEGRGQLCGPRLAWLDAQLAQDPRPTVIAMHHPPFATGIPYMDTLGLEGADVLERILGKYPHVERVLCGHLHRSIQCRFGGTLASTCPSPAYQLTLDLRANAPERFVLEPPGYQLHQWHAGRLVSHACVVGEYAGPYGFCAGGS
ncbi:phosphodiesterase [Verminephrobacter aporrectodeae]|uniref:phosphodiesterase n=1 Tax=Verminephrobacter aporrectodeae TaxID=1110389 RepID=UPI00023756FE|nr:phosphodiesterase [Verminephrobacter aporrectodeae]MCW5221937.1 phosphodiesterase [Verminephrobacter aporrectodeae subsp. tuberculatae]MCW5258261.1 phosphodiesterase [Verminephrobacter aporrectodeae subsp. tuberculatae]MCW5291228.1 phosphodiesterase [Verminephrobacter aporrectodeae subsp. tuberculatae]MCW8174619.1 phosphodiesterase [Verminephrobacter aporrectodeae subsp. tuberculatae]MCW8203035.1 phosphodiesterase [Verminephrobacter aporrectodeae subsp. tuberculatae]